MEIVTYNGCFAEDRRYSSEPASTDLLRNRSVNIPKHQLRNREPTRDRSPIESYSNVEFCFRPVSTSVDSNRKKASHIVTRIQEQIHYRSPGTSSGKQLKARSESQPQIRSGSKPRTIEVDQIWLALLQLATNSISAKFNNNIRSFSKLAKYRTTTKPKFDGKSENFELFGDLFLTSLKIYNQFTEKSKINYFPSLMHSDALQFFENIISLNREDLEIRLSVFPRNYVKPPVNGDG